MNSPFGAETKIFNTFKKRDRLISDTDGGSLNAGFFNPVNSMVNTPATSYDTELKRLSRSKSFEFKNSNLIDCKNLGLTDYNSSLPQSTVKQPPCECAGKVLALLNQLLTYCDTLQNERDKALESLRVERECKTRSISLLNESIAREKQLIKEVDNLRDKFNSLKQ
ncbi:hypothetical protein BMR1_03g02025 [Babesia microti strain RI]|uniref:Uncharacterized protein n=1 Tax=Babesia microti (strain RI) TaxID=1133968 RepID=A0A1R4ABM0_BABMR|nr:hypothetical protein BMR1_03g02025 [Babesia microti strain RI]SJK86412.1 hypothetical protein BMR1_03g02025 [Babesia microti strain RI]|eukprot:XP_021338573.1 hypothetical protein BMR1_03g02025 [Babesia microti strain RI]